MIEHRQLPAEQIPKAAATLKAHLPEYGALLNFYEQLFVAQEKSKLQTCLEPIVIAPEVLRLKRREKLPLVETTEFVFDATTGRKLLVQICAIIQAADNEMASSAQRLAAAVEGSLEVESIFRHLLAGDDRYFTDTADRIGSDKNTLAFVGYSSLKPSLVVCSEQLSTYLTDHTQWTAGICPVCGNLPAIGMLDDEGRRSVCCSFCWHQWPLARVYCPFCGSTDPNMLHYLYSESEKAFRVDCCENCRKYIKTVDARSANRPIYPPLEQVASLHLDMKAREGGFGAGIPLHLTTD